MTATYLYSPLDTNHANRCYQLPVSRATSSNTSGNEIDRVMGNIICERCNNQIKGLFINVGKNEFYHPECFSCTDCFEMIAHSEQYSKYSDTLLCGRCSQTKQLLPSIKDSYNTRKFSNSQIILIKVQRCYLNGVEFDLFVDTAKRKLLQLKQLEMDEVITELYVKTVPEKQNSGIFQLKVEDRILEVQGVLVINQTTGELQELFLNLTTTMVSIVIERKIPGQAMTPNPPLKDRCLGIQGWCQECNEVVTKPQLQRSVETDRRRAFHGKDKQTSPTEEEFPNTITTTTTTTTETNQSITAITNNHQTLSKATGYPERTQMGNTATTTAATPTTATTTTTTTTPTTTPTTATATTTPTATTAPTTTTTTTTTLPTTTTTTTTLPTTTTTTLTTTTIPTTTAKEKGDMAIPPNMKFSLSAPDPLDSEETEDINDMFTSPSCDIDDLTTRSETAILSIPACDAKLETCSSMATGLSRLHALRCQATNSIRRGSQDGFLFRPADLITGRSLGNGFFGQVYLVTDSITGKKYAMKQLTRGDSSSITKELTILKSLNHPNILRFIGVIPTENSGINIITEFLDGGTLNTAICKKEDFPWLDRVRISRDIAAGMDYLHEHNIIHRDLNSHNVLLRKDLTAVVADFGLARTVEGETLKPVNSLRFKSRRKNCNTTTKPITMGVKNIKRKMTIVGNMAWMAPEMMKDKLYNEMVDVYSFGVIICELLSRLNADPDYIPRNPSFTIDWENFIPTLQTDCPLPLVGLAQHATQDDSDYRPPFEVSHIALHHLCNQLERNQPIDTALHDCFTLLH